MRRKRIAWMAAAMLCCGAWAFAAGKTVGHVCDVEFAADKAGKPGWVTLDCRSGSEYDAGHIPGAVNYRKPAHQVLKNPVDGRRVSDEKAARLLGQIGLDNNKGLIVYGKKGDFRVAIEMLPIYLGVKQFYYLDGGFEAWTGGGKPVQTDPVIPVSADFHPKVSNRKLYVSTYEMMQFAKNPPKNVTFIDNRPRAEYDGIEVSTIRGGRFPGAIHVAYERNLDPVTGKMLPDDALREIYRDIPIGNTVILYGHKSSRTSFSYFALERLGYKNVRIYEEGWIVYGARPDTIMEAETFQDRRETVKQAGEVPDLKRRIEILEEKLEKLEKK